MRFKGWRRTSLSLGGVWSLTPPCRHISTYLVSPYLSEFLVSLPRQRLTLATMPRRKKANPRNGAEHQNLRQMTHTSSKESPSQDSKNMQSASASVLDTATAGRPDAQGNNMSPQDHRPLTRSQTRPLGNSQWPSGRVAQLNPTAASFDFRTSFHGSSGMANVLYASTLSNSPVSKPGSTPANTSRLPIRSISKAPARGQFSSIKPPPQPEPTRSYITQSNMPAVKQSNAQRLLVVLDLNGTLINRNRNTGAFRERPGLHPFLSYLFQYHEPMVYTSAKPQNAAKIVKALFTVDEQQKLIAVWGRDKLALNARQYNNKVQVYKKLEVIWRDAAIQAKASKGTSSWSQTNTILIDDSILKGAAQPHNLVLVPEFENTSNENESVLRELVLKLEVLKMQADVSCLIRQWQLGTSTAPTLPPHANTHLQNTLETWLEEGSADAPKEKPVHEVIPQDQAASEASAGVGQGVDRRIKPMPGGPVNGTMDEERGLGWGLVEQLSRLTTETQVEKKTDTSIHTRARESRSLHHDISQAHSKRLDPSYFTSALP